MNVFCVLELFCLFQALLCRLRCNKYYVQGPKKGTIEKFCDVPGMPDNIHYDGQGQYLIAMFTVLYPPAS